MDLLCQQCRSSCGVIVGGDRKVRCLNCGEIVCFQADLMASLREEQVEAESLSGDEH